MSYFGKEFILESQEGFEKILDEFPKKSTPERKAEIINHKSTIKVVKNGDEYTIINSVPGTTQTRDEKFKNGVEVDEAYGDLKWKTSYTVDGNKITSVSKYPEGYTTEAIREFSDNQVVITFKTSKGTVCKRIYKPN
ncbi:hypothetical protein NE865_08650 [Phthorimaea operculella]|nr:hypothetical protein NE865_08650 [Phthorimaea operculella]